MSKYEEFDKALVDLIGRGFNTMSKLESLSDVKLLAAPHQTKQCHGIKPVFRVIDTRLQVLRKAGKIAHNGKVWEIIK